MKPKKASKAGSQEGLSHDKVRRAALRLIEADGLDAFSTRKLGRALGCEAMAIYWYYPSKDALLDAVVDLLLGSIAPQRDTGSAEWLEVLRQVTHAYRRIAHTHPNAFPLLATRRLSTAGGFEFLERLFAIAERQGIPDRTTARYFRAVSAYCSGFALDELAGGRQAGRKDLRATRATFPRVRAVSTWLEPEHDDALFDFGLEVLLGSFAGEVTPKAAKPKTTRRAGSRGAS